MTRILAAKGPRTSPVRVGGSEAARAWAGSLCLCDFIESRITAKTPRRSGEALMGLLWQGPAREHRVRGRALTARRLMMCATRRCGNCGLDLRDSEAENASQ